MGKNALTVVIYGLNFSFKIQFLKVSRRKNQRFFPSGPFFLVLYMIVHQCAVIARKLPCPKKFLVTRLKLDIQFDKQVTNKVSDIDLSNQQEFGQIPEIRDSATEVDRLKGYFCSKFAFNLSKKVLTDLTFHPFKKSLNEPELRKHFEEFSRRMRCK